MSNKSIVLNTNRPGLFTPRVRGSQSENSLANRSKRERTLKTFANTNLESSASFRYGDKVGMVSTQQINTDYSRFENHTFFHSAVAKVNESFERIINFYPYDANNKELEDYEDTLTGFEKYVLDSFPKNVGYLMFSGTQVGETTGGTSIAVVDKAGAEETSLASLKTGESLLNPGNSPFSFEFFINVPEQVNDNQIIVQKFKSNTVSENMTIALSQSASTSECDIIFGVTTGSNFLYVSSSIEKGKFKHIFAGYNKIGDQKLHIITDLTNKVSSSTALDFDDLNFSNSSLLLGSGSSARLNDQSLLFIPQQTLSASIDEFRYYRSYRTDAEIKKYQHRNLDINRTDEESNLLLYYKFNEPYGSYDGNSLVLDSSGNSFNTKIINFNIANRNTGSDSPVLKENINRSPVLFPSFPTVLSLNNNLMTTASLYDDANPNLITKLVPPHYFEEANIQEDFNSILGTFSTDTSLKGGASPGTTQIKSAQRLTIFLLIWAKFFDELKIFGDAFSKINNLSYDEYDTIPDALLRKAGEINGIKLPALFRGANIDQLFEGVDLNKNPVQSQKPLLEIQNIVWRRILASLPFIKLTKGTLQSVKSVFRSAGIEPDNIFLIREFGGSFERRIDKIKEQKKDVIQLLPFTGSNSLEAQTLNHQGRPNKKPNIISGFLSGSRIETGAPEIRKRAATGTLTCVSTTLGDYHGRRIRIVSTDGTSIIYQIDQTGATGLATGDELGGEIIVNVTSASNRNDVAEEIKVAIEHNKGHAGRITVVRASNELELQQRDAQFRGTTNTANTIITHTAPGTSIITTTGFSGGFGMTKTGNEFFHGISDYSSNGLFTSGSFTFEGQYRFHSRFNHEVTQSLARLHVTGTQHSSQFESAVVNLLYNSASNELTLFVVDSPNPSIATPFVDTSLVLTGVNMFDSDLWNVSFGVTSGIETGNVASGSLFLRAGKASAGKIENQYLTSSFYNRVLDSGSPTSVFSNISELNTSGTFITIGSQSLGGAASNTFINDEDVLPFYKTTNFTGEVGAIRFWSKNLSESEWQSHLRNPVSFGTTDLEKSYLFENVLSGSFQKLRLQTSTKQATTASDLGGGFRLFDFSHNNLHLTGSGFESDKKLFRSEHIIFNSMSPYFDLSIADQKVRIRSLEDNSRKLENPYALTTPVYEVFPGERTLDDPRFAIEMSSVKGLNDDIIKIFSDYEFFEDALGKTNLIFGDRYPDMINLRKLYFENVLEQLDLGKYRELFKWIDGSFTDLVGNMLPHTTKFMGINFVYENHMLERSRFRYLYDEIYLKSKAFATGGTPIMMTALAIAFPERY